MTDPIKGDRWTAYDRGTHWDLRYYDGGKRRKHRVPPVVQGRRNVKQYAITYVKKVLRKDKGTGEQALTDKRSINPRITFQQFGELWTSGYLHRAFPERVEAKDSANTDASRLEKHVYPVIGDYQVRAFQGEQGVEWAEAVLRHLAQLRKPPSRSTTRQVAQVVSRILTMAAFTSIRLLPHSPLHRGYVPPVPKKKKTKSYLYPDEEAMLMGNTELSLRLRVLFGLLSREGARIGNFLSLQFKQLDLKRGIITLDDTKTDQPLEWDLDAGTTEGLKRYRDRFVHNSGPIDFLFLDEKGNLNIDGKILHPSKLATTLREAVSRSGVDRYQLFEHTENRIKLRAHDLRTGFVTTKLAMGKSESWIMARTGHESSQMIANYNQGAQTHAARKLGDYLPLYEAIPELREIEAEDA